MALWKAAGFSRRLTEGVRREQISPESLRSRDRRGFNSCQPARDASHVGLESI